MDRDELAQRLGQLRAAVAAVKAARADVGRIRAELVLAGVDIQRLTVMMRRPCDDAEVAARYLGLWPAEARRPRGRPKGSKTLTAAERAERLVQPGDE